MSAPDQIDRLVTYVAAAGINATREPTPAMVRRLDEEMARLSAVLAAARDVVDAYRAIEAFAVPYASCPGHTNESGVRDDGRHDACAACRANDRADADIDAADRVLAGSELNLCNAIAAADGAA